MDGRTTIDKVRSLFRKSDAEPDYEPLDTDNEANDLDEDVRRPVLVVSDPVEGEPFSWFEYSIFLLLGIAMLWAWYFGRILCKDKSLMLK